MKQVNVGQKNMMGTEEPKKPMHLVTVPPAPPVGVTHITAVNCKIEKTSGKPSVKKML